MGITLTHYSTQKTETEREKTMTLEQMIKQKEACEERIRKDIDNLGILNEAEKNTTDFFVAMFNQIGIEKVNVIFE